MKKILLIVIQLLLLLTSCAANESKKAYCFSMVFEKDADNRAVTAYCKTLKDAASGEMDNIALKFSGKNFKEALDKAGKGDYDIYFSSIHAYYTSKELNKKDLTEISLILFDNAKYRTDNHVFDNKDDAEPEKLHKIAANVCDNEEIRKSEMHLYTSTLSYFRNKFIKTDNK